MKQAYYHFLSWCGIWIDHNPVMNAMCPCNKTKKVIVLYYNGEQDEGMPDDFIWTNMERGINGYNIIAWMYV